jgi:hypothetical protein
VLLYLGFAGVVAGTLGTAFKVLGFLPLLTGILRHCPAYTLFGMSTCKVKAKASVRPPVLARRSARCARGGRERATGGRHR